MALSVRLPPDKGPYIEHYLIQSSSGRLGLETSENRFDDIPSLIAHYANCCDELPVQLMLPKAIREARSRQQLSSYALLGQEFWRYSPPPSASSSPDADLVLNLNPLMSTFKAAEPSTPVSKDSKPTRPNTLNLINNVDPKNESRIEPIKCIPSFKNEPVSKTPPPPPPRWSKPTTPQNNITVTTTVTFSVNSQSPRTEQPPTEIICDTKRMSPEGQTSTISSKGSSLRRGPETITSPSGSILSPNSDSNSLMTPDTLSPLSVTKTARTSRRTKHKVSKHYQESDILESPTVYYRSAVGDKISDYEDLWTNEHANQKNKTTSLASPDLLQHTGTVVSLNNNILSPSESQTTGSQHSHCSTPNGNQNSSNLSVQSPISDTNGAMSSQEQAYSPKQSSPFYAEPADSLSQNPVPRRILNRNIIPVQQRHSNPAALISHSPMNPSFEKIDPNDFNGTMSSSVDNLSPKQKLLGIKKPEVKPVLPPSIKPKVADTWQVDNSWKFVGM
ncbi:hypothetical protein AMK59_4140 [Oryctes borbonicus]|uniref:SH2 domain-containing protein n=1 Tax=Oryctes borbonicus TaxID=1629725 RepID=A0A0T6B8L8_9SCAR|nr:hypothetical protein AMK59_4140 [Oryctes borbonicus]